ncbi:low molecular weight protein-tyrosine-phosphatase [Tropicimonas sp. IMCC34043]|uniref:low molecular weight protein-tyrosine-phosphatase n=1 Tax=Tropicimonas sp. IMCC34043 TaxID=2248760 RepID=UPI000E272FE4|nr:low molecular weight protein-tyrosine-phosphatase [Tropicimonas sp. IMCC34043]
MSLDGNARPPSVLFVCLGNICRSPTAEGVARRMAALGGVEAIFDSAGTDAYHGGSAPDPRMQKAAREYGYDLRGLIARQFLAEDFERFDLILAMDRNNLRAIEDLRPRGNTTPVRLFLSYGPSERLDVPDPYYSGGFDAVVRLIEHGVMGLLADLREMHL